MAKRYADCMCGTRVYYQDQYKHKEECKFFTKGKNMSEEIEVTPVAEPVTEVVTEVAVEAPVATPEVAVESAPVEVTPQ